MYKQSNKGLLPARWLDCPKIGNLINDLFLPFKTPIDNKENIINDSTKNFSLNSLLNMKISRDVGLIIDLTNTYKYYNSEQLSGIKCYFKIACEGHEEGPTENQVKSFIEISRRFFELNQDAFVGVHCTHGYNRTGFMIVSYLCECSDMELDTALHVFANARPPGIYKQGYLDELIKRYDYQGVIIAPPLPQWSIDIDEEKFEQKINLIPKVSFKPQNPIKKIILPKQETLFMSGVNGVSTVTDTHEKETVHLKVRNLMRSKKPTFIGAQPVTMTRENLHLIVSRPYLVSWKADGTRYVMFISKEGSVYMLDRENTVFRVHYLNFPKDKNSHLFDTLLDGEMVIDVFRNERIPRYLIYDIMSLNGDYVGIRPLNNRLALVADIIKARNELVTLMMKSEESFSVRLKFFWTLDMANELWNGKFRQELSHEMDGLIFQPSGDNDFYQIGTCTSMLKWKPPNLNSIDFFLKREKVFEQGFGTSYSGKLYVTGLDKPFGILDDSKTDLSEKYDNQIVECTLNQETMKWNIIRPRTDKTKPNFIKTAESVYNNILHPVNIQDVYNIIANNIRKTYCSKK